ncbi:MAG: hypothetical protein WA755_18190 [Candidatus Acidiferrales bacterium]
MASHYQSGDAFGMERVLLAALCQLRSNDSRRAKIFPLLANHFWQSPDHRVIYEALRGWKAEPADIRTDLAARLTRMGFPDTGCDFCFAPFAGSLDAAIDWLRESMRDGQAGGGPMRNGPSGSR